MRIGVRQSPFNVEPVEVDLFRARGMTLMQLKFRYELKPIGPGLILNFLRGDLFLGRGDPQDLVAAVHPAEDLLVSLLPARIDERSASPLIDPKGQQVASGQFYFNAHLLPAQMKAIEERRQADGGNCELSARLYFELQDDAQRTLERCHMLSLTTGQSDWVAKLGATDFLQTQLLEIPRFISADTRFASVNRTYADALLSAQAGDWKGAIRQGRDVLELIEVALNDKTQNVRGDEYKEEVEQQKSPRDRTKDERLRFIRTAAKNFVHLSAHADGTSAETSWRADDAYGFLQLLAGLLRMLAAC